MAAIGSPASAPPAWQPANFGISTFGLVIVTSPGPRGIGWLPSGCRGTAHQGRGLAGAHRQRQATHRGIAEADRRVRSHRQLAAEKTCPRRTAATDATRGEAVAAVEVANDTDAARGKSPCRRWPCPTAATVAATARPTAPTRPTRRPTEPERRIPTVSIPTAGSAIGTGTPRRRQPPGDKTDKDRIDLSLTLSPT
jgi:hypothetical protein